MLSFLSFLLIPNLSCHPLAITPGSSLPALQATVLWLLQQSGWSLQTLRPACVTLWS